MYRLTIDMQPDLRDGRTSRISANSPNKKNLGMPASKAKSVQRGSEPKVQISVAKSERKKVSCQDEESCTARSGSGNYCPGHLNYGWGHCLCLISGRHSTLHVLTWQYANDCYEYAGKTQRAGTPD